MKDHLSRNRLDSDPLAWDPVGDDDELYIQSDDHPIILPTRPPPPPPPHSMPSGGSSRKRRRTSTTTYQSSQENQIPPPPTSTLQRPRQPYKPPAKKTCKYDSEGCANCQTHQSTCWWRKNRLVSDLDGTQAWTEDKLCNTCSIYWNKNGFHRHVPAKSRKRPDAQLPPSQPPNSSSQASNSLQRISSTSQGSAQVFGSRSVSLAKSSAPPPLSHRRHTRSPSQLAKAAERESHNLKRTLSRKTSLFEVAPNAHDTPHHEEFTAGHSSSLPTFTSASKQHSVDPPPSQSTTDDEFSVTKRIFDAFLAQTVPQSSVLDSKVSTTTTNSEMDFFSEYTFDESIPTDQSEETFNFFNLAQPNTLAPLHASSGFGLNLSLTPPRTPPSQIKAPSRTPDIHHHHNSAKPNTRSSPSFNLNHLLSPSFLNASPNSLLKKLNSEITPSEEEDKTFVMGSTGQNLGEQAQFMDFDKIFLSSSVGHLPSGSLAPPSPTQEQPSKKAKGPANGKSRAANVQRDPPLPFPWDLHSASSSSYAALHSSKASIFPAPPGPSSVARADPIRMTTVGNENECRAAAYKSPPLKSRRPKPTSLLKETVIMAPSLFGTSQQVHLERSRSELLLGREPSLGRVGTQGRLAGPSSRANTARTIWSRPFSSSSGLLPSSDDHFLAPPAPPSARNRLLSSPSTSDAGFYIASSAMASQEAEVSMTGLSSTLVKQAFRSESEDHRVPFSEDMTLQEQPSSPPVLPPPSDCSEGITTPLSPGVGGLFSDDDDDQGANDEEEVVGTEAVDQQVSPTEESQAEPSVLKDITRESLNEPHPEKQQTEELSPEVLSAFREAIKAGWTPEDLAQALRSINSGKGTGGGANGERAAGSK